MRRSFLVCFGASLAGCFNPESASEGGTDGTDTSDESTTTSPTGEPTVSGSTSNTTPPDTSVSETTPPETSDTEIDPDSTGTTTAPPVDCEGPDGEPDSTCPAEAPFCQGGTCVGCDAITDGEAGCTALDPTTPVCGSAGACVGCTEHDECSSGACRSRTGECFAEPNRLWVDNTSCANGVGTEDAPLCSVAEAVAIIDNQAGEEPWAVFVAGSPMSYQGTIDPNSGRAIAIIGPEQGISATLEGDGEYALDLWAQSPETYLAHVTLISNSNAPSTIRGGGQCWLGMSDVALTQGTRAIETNGCEVRARRSLITGSFDLNVHVSPGGTFVADDTEISNASGGMLVEGTATLHRTRVWGHYVGGGIEVSGSLHLVNSIVHQNEYTNDGVHASGGDVNVLYSTIVGALTCTPQSTVAVRNSIVLGHNSEAGMSCTLATVDNSVVNAGVAQGTGNVMAAAADLPNIFVDAAQYGGDYHVLADSVPSGVAMWQDGDPAVDFDGDERPGAGDYAGADIP
jgi:hypothetical protein